MTVVFIQGSVYALQESVSPVLCKFWWLYGGVNGDFLQRAYAINQVCWTQSSCPSCRPLLTHISSGDTQTVLAQCRRVSGSWCTQGSFEPSEHRWWVRGLILNAISPLLPSCLASPFPQTWGIFSKSLQHCTAAAHEPGSCHSSTYCQIHINHI